MKKPETISNMELHKDHLLLSINPKIFPLDIVYSAAYTLLDKAYIVLDGDPEEEIIAEIRPKTKTDLQKLGDEFNNELINYAVYKKQSERNAVLRQTILQRALLTNGFKDKEDIIEDPDEILVPWEEKYGKK
ncbi:MAG: hypothetical protein ABIC04_01705 [Nanoarchaeota archaeon]